MKRLIRTGWEWLLLYFLAPLFRVLALFIARDKKLVLLGSMNGHYFGDNSSHLYLWMLQEGVDSFKPLWLTRNRKVLNELRNQGQPAYLQWHPQALLAILRAHTICFTHSFKDVVPSGYLIPGRCKVVYLTHDIAPKRSRHARIGQSISEKKRRRSAYEKKRVTDYISTSPFISSCRATALDVKKKRFAITGLPRNDVLVRRQHDRSKKILYPKTDSPPEQVVLYAPTWRSGRKATKLLPFDDLDMDVLKNELGERNTVLLIRCHKNDLGYSEVRTRIKELTDGTDRIIDATHRRFGDVNSILPEIDVLMTDYSGILHDFLLLDRPCILIPYDLREFEQANGFFYDYCKLVPGPQVYTFKEFLNALCTSLENPKESAQKRKQLRDLIFSYYDDQACKRVSELIQNESTY